MIKKMILASVIISSYTFAKPIFTMDFGQGIIVDGKKLLPILLALRENDSLVLLDIPNDRVVVLNNDYTIGALFGSSGSGDGQFKEIVDIATAPNNDLLVVDTGNNKVSVWNSDYTYKTAIYTGDLTPFRLQLNNKGLIAIICLNDIHSIASKVSIYFDPSSWIEEGITILGTLPLNQDLTLKQGYILSVRSVDNLDVARTVTDGILSIYNKAVLTAELGSSIDATSILLKDGTLILNTTNVQGNITYNAAGTLNVNANLTNNIDFAGNAGLLQLADGKTITGNINSTNNSAGTLEFLGNNTVTGNINNVARIKLTNNLKVDTLTLNGATLESDGGSIDATVSNMSNTTILLDSTVLKLSGTHNFTDQITLSSNYDEANLSGGNILLASGSTLDLSNVSKLIIKLTFINRNINQVSADTKYQIILAEEGSNIVLLSDPENMIVLDSNGEQNRFTKWTLDASSLTLYASDDSDNDYVFDSVQNNTFMQELKNATPDSLSQEFRNNIGLLSKEQVEDMFSRILNHPKERSSDIVRVALHQALTDTSRTVMNVIHNRLLSTGPSHTIASAGDEGDVNKYGVWARASITQSKDKVNSKRSEYFSSYKTRGHSNTIGADGLICDNLLVGAAYTNAYTSIRPKDQNIGNIDKVRTNMFSLYSTYNIPNYNWYLDGTVSYAESSIIGQKIRYLAVARDVLVSEVASSKYKSRLYSGSVSLGYNHYIGENIYVTPSIGAIGSLIRDSGYTETGTSFQNLTVRKKSYNKLTGVAGLRTYQDIYIDNNESGVIVTPEAYGFVNYNIKNKTPAIDARLAGIDQPLPTISHRSNRVDYNLGLGITIKQNMMEYGINYDA